MSKIDERLLRPLRQQASTIKRDSDIEEFYSDRSRIIYASSFRRLQQKAQVFSLEPNSNVRTRLTHSLEVADVGRTIANKIGNELLKQKKIRKAETIPLIVAIIENACLLHDIGNPPFGHFGEAAIRDWIKKNLKACAYEAGIGQTAVAYVSPDFLEFDGNPQGFRTVTRLHCERDQNGLNLTYPTLLSVIKYPRKAGDKQVFDTQKKAGYFLSEAPILDKIYREMEVDPQSKYPLSYIMEAADDISYCLSDISDGIAKRILTLDGFLNTFRNEWHKQYGNEPYPFEIPERYNGYFNTISINWSRAIVEEIVQNYTDNIDDYIDGKRKSIVSSCSCGKALEVIKTVSRKILYRSIEAEGNELSGYAIMTGLLDSFGELLKMTKAKFTLLTNEQNSPANAGIDLQWRLYNRLSVRMIKSYKYQLEEHERNAFAKAHSLGENDIEWWLRVHLIIDHISGMTDAYALEMYQMLSGVIRV